jgi:hypothetical protein
MLRHLRQQLPQPPLGPLSLGIGYDSQFARHCPVGRLGLSLTDVGRVGRPPIAAGAGRRLTVGFRQSLPGLPATPPTRPTPLPIQVAISHLISPEHRHPRRPARPRCHLGPCGPGRRASAVGDDSRRPPSLALWLGMPGNLPGIAWVDTPISRQHIPRGHRRRSPGPLGGGPGGGASGTRASLTRAWSANPRRAGAAIGRGGRTLSPSRECLSGGWTPTRPG